MRLSPDRRGGAVVTRQASSLLGLLVSDEVGERMAGTGHKSTCAMCGKDFTALRLHSRYCSPSCKKRAANDRARGKAPKSVRGRQGR
jgi:hypothetical protein